ncbi:coiled-coil domain-containing protein 117 [Neoarius graeffei]|uniref:coiled-coil domain-containing protein 117 n=1 Tax=Neoarius graeffei TaxID=443677 RepID=UPI00298C4F91|nr:coiled-coil domain-containing protein 117 [Neoarius graeffei]
MQSASPGSRDLGYFPSMFSSLPHFTVPDMSISKGKTSSSFHLPGSSMTNSSWERRCLRKHRRRTDDEGCSAKRQKMMDEGESDPLEDARSRPDPEWLAECATVGSPTVQHCGTSAPPSPNTQYNRSPLPAVRVETEGSCMEVEAAQRKLQEIENRITLEDDSDEDLDVEPPQRRPVLVLSDSLREGLQRGIADILPHTVAQSVSRSCMELVLWRPLEDPFTQQLKDSLQRQQRKQQPVCRQTPTPVPVHAPKRLDEHTFSPLACPSAASSSTEEDMEL